MQLRYFSTVHRLFYLGAPMTLRQDLLTSLEAYLTTWCTPKASYLGRTDQEERPVAERFISFVSVTPGCFARTNLDGHMTGSALVVNKSLTKVLLTHHKKLNLWLQLGGHADGHHLLHEVAMTEAIEESGLQNLSHLSYERDVFGAAAPDHLPFDVDCHLIPANAKDPEHRHFDVRYLVVAASETMPVVSGESHDVRWFDLKTARSITSERSMHRQFYKLDWLKIQLGV
jgi:ADP-ribose pyrophosphatase YjhB (NUDIX family)